VLACPAQHRERPDAVGAHVPERHWRPPAEIAIRVREYRRRLDAIPSRPILQACEGFRLLLPPRVLSFGAPCPTDLRENSSADNLKGKSEIGVGLSNPRITPRPFIEGPVRLPAIKALEGVGDRSHQPCLGMGRSTMHEDVWNTTYFHRAIQKRIGETLSAGYDLSTPLPDRMRILLGQLDEPNADGLRNNERPPISR
jgi:hypothetical protein